MEDDNENYLGDERKYKINAGEISVIIPDSYFSSSSTTNTSTTEDDDDSNPYSSKIIIENVYITDSQGERIDKIDKDSPPFTLVVTYVDYGLREVDSDEFTDRNIEVYLTDLGGFVPGSGTRGSIRYTAASYNDAPRFRASFPNLTYSGTGNTVSFWVNYDIMGYDVEGESASVSVPQANEDDSEKMKPLTPHLIVSEYSYGGQPIVAGETFSLNMTMRNTSAGIPLENIIMTIAPYIPENNTGSTTGGLTITSASNTYYIERLEVGETFSQAVELRAEPSAAVGSHRMNIDFQFQFVDEVNKTREEGTDEESIAIPVTQVDRFSVDPLTEVPDSLVTGEEGYITLSFVNRGKTITYNISGTITGENLVNAGQSQHYGNLEAGKAGTLDFDVLYNEPGEHHGEIVLQYEDENTNELEVTLPFYIMIEERYVPPAEPPGGWEEDFMQDTGPSTFTITMCSVGGVLIASPITLYLRRRIKVRGIEEADEDF